MNMENCWASCLGDCEGGMSREHVVSESLFESEYIDVLGYPWCKDSPKRIGLASFTKKALCRKHNSDLSEIDTAGAHAFRVLREQTKLAIERGKEPSKKYPKVAFNVDASRLELWLIKTLINISYGGQHFIGAHSQKRGLPSDDLVHVVFGRQRLPKENGLYLVFKTGLGLQFGNRVEMSPLVRYNTHIHGAFFKFYGMPMFLDLVPGGMTVPFDDVPGVHPDWHYTVKSRRFRQFKARGFANRVSHIVNFNWR